MMYLPQPATVLCIFGINLLQAFYLLSFYLQSTSSLSLSRWGLSWSPYNVGCLATAADDMKVCIWDTQIRPKTSELSTSLSSSTSQHLRQSSFPSSSITPLLTLQKHTASVQVRVFSEFNPNLLFSLFSFDCIFQDVTWSPSQETVLVSVGDDGKLILWDTRIPTSSTAQEV